MASTERTPLLSGNTDVADAEDSREETVIRRSWNTLGDMISPFSSAALASLPDRAALAQRVEDVNIQQGKNDMSVRTDHIPDPPAGSSEPRNYQAISSQLPPGVKVPKKIATPIKVEGKVWFANERTWVAYTNLGVVLGTLALALFNSSRDPISQWFGYGYGFISILVIIYGYWVYQLRVSMIRRRDPGNFDQVIGPVLIGVTLFVAILVNFVIRFRQFLAAEQP